MRRALTTSLAIACAAPLVLFAAGCESPPMDMWISMDPDAGAGFDAPAREVTTDVEDDTSTTGVGGTGGDTGTGTGGVGGDTGSGGAAGTGGDTGSGGGGASGGGGVGGAG